MNEKEEWVVIKYDVIGCKFSTLMSPLRTKHVSVDIKARKYEITKMFQYLWINTVNSYSILKRSRAEQGKIGHIFNDYYFTSKLELVCLWKWSIRNIRISVTSLLDSQYCRADKIIFDELHQQAWNYTTDIINYCKTYWTSRLKDSIRPIKL